jgi:hypothetical protein
MTIGSKANPFINSLNVKKWSYKESLTAEKGSEKKVCLKGINHPDSTKFIIKDFLNGEVGKDISFFKYTGSLTKPPCTEHVEWFVLKNAAEISSS